MIHSDPTEPVKTNYVEYPIGAGYYAMRINTTKKGKVYAKLVRADRSGKPNFAQELEIRNKTGVRKPQIGKRTRIKHRARSPK